MSLPLVDTAGVWNWYLYQGDTRVCTFSLEDPDENPIDVSGAVITMTIKKVRGANVPNVWVGSTTGGQITVSGTGGNIVTVTITSTSSDDFANGSLVYDVEFVQNGITQTYVTGTITVTREVTP